LLAQGFKNRVGNLSARKRVVHRVFKHYLLRLGRRRPYLQRKRIRRIRYIIKRARSRHRKYLLWRLRDRLIGAFNRRNQKSYGYPRVSPIKRPVRLSKRQKKKKSAQKKLLRKALAISIRKKFYTKHSKIKAVRLVLTQTRNNFFFSVQTTWGKVRLVYTNGRTNFKGSRRYSYVATEEAGSNISKFLRSRGVKNFYIIFKSRFTTFCRAGFFGLISRLRCKRAFLRLLVPHNGLRKRSSRRV
jgi:ribosomal protein S11